MNLQTFKFLGDFDSEKIVNEVQDHLGSKNHVSLQSNREFLYNFEYTNSILKEYNLFNSRIMSLNGKKCYTWHRDNTPRVHLPIITNSNCLFVLEDKAFKMPAGNIYWVDTRKSHTALNGNKDYTRYHIVGMTNELF